MAGMLDNISNLGNAGSPQQIGTGLGFAAGGVPGAMLGYGASNTPNMFTGPGVAGMAGQGPSYDPNAVNQGKPGSPNFWSPMDQGTGQLQDKYSLADKIQQMQPAGSIQGQVDQRLAGANVNQDALQGMRDYALGSGNSPWLNSALAQSQAQLGQNLSDTAANSAGNAANARSNLAMSHGLSGGAAERLGTQADRDSMAAQQGLRSQNMLGNMNLQTQEQAGKLGMLGQLAGAEQNLGQFNLNKTGMGINQMGTEQQMQNQANMYNTQAANAAQGTDLQTKLGTLGAQNQFNQTQYGQQMADWAAQQQAAATAGNQTSGGLLDKLNFTKWHT